MQNCFLFFFFFFLFSLFFFLHVKLFLLFCIISFFLFFFQNVFFPFIIFLLRRIFLFIQIYLIFYISLFYMYSAQRPEGLVTPNSKSFLACISFVPCQVISCSTLLLHLHDNFWPSFLSASRFWLHHYNMKNRKTYLHDMIYDVPLPRTRIRLYIIQLNLFLFARGFPTFTEVKFDSDFKNGEPSSDELVGFVWEQVKIRTQVPAENRVDFWPFDRKQRGKVDC